VSFDTVIFKKSFEPQAVGFWRDVGFEPAKHWRLVRNGKGVGMTVYPAGYQGKDWLMAQASLPKIVFGHNAALPNEQQARMAASWLCSHVSGETGLTFTLDDAKAFGIDYTRDYDIREDTAPAIALALLPKALPDFERVIRHHDTVLFRHELEGKTARQILIYPKFTWASDTQKPQHVVEASRGKLRLEVRLERKGLKAVKGAIKPLDYLSQSISEAVLDEAATMLDLQHILDARDFDFHERLIVHACGQRTLGKLGLPTFIELVKRHGPEFHRTPEFHYPKSTYHKRKNELEKLGIWDDLVAASQMQLSYE